MSEAIIMTASLTAEPSLWAMLKEDLNCVFQRDPAARSTLEVLATYPGVHALLTHRFSHRLWQSGWRFPARFLSPAQFLPGKRLRCHLANVFG
jgi:serine O-acetyltransferase